MGSSRQVLVGTTLLTLWTVLMAAVPAQADRYPATDDGTEDGAHVREPASQPSRDATDTSSTVIIRPPDPPPGALTATSGRPFDAGSAWNTPIPAAAALDPASSRWASALAEGRHSANTFEFGIPIFYADASTPRHDIAFSRVPDWGPDPLPGAIPIPPETRPHQGSDGAVTVVDTHERKVYGLWRARTPIPGLGWTAGWGGVTDLDGPGNGDGSTGAGVSRLAGTVLAREIAAGHIPHALVFSTDMAQRGVFRHPAIKTDGSNMAGAATPIPQGARVQLDPSIDVDAIPGISPAERTIAKALQTYGAYVMDNGGARMAFSFELLPDATSGNSNGAVYQRAGLAWDYFDMRSIPWDRLQVLRQWDGS